MKILQMLRIQDSWKDVSDHLGASLGMVIQQHYYVLQPNTSFSWNEVLWKGREMKFQALPVWFDEKVFLFKPFWLILDSGSKNKTFICVWLKSSV